MDDRNQFDMFWALPGGLGGVARFVAALRARGVSVLFPYAYLAWDTGTRREGVRDEEAVMARGRASGEDGELYGVGAGEGDRGGARGDREA